MTKITFIGAGSLGFHPRAGARHPHLPPAARCHPVPDGYRPRTAGFCLPVGQKDRRPGRLSRQGRRHPRPGRSPQGRRCRPGHHPGRRHRCLAARHPDPQEIRRRHQRRRHPRRRRHLPRPAHHPGHASHRQGHGAILPERHHAQLHQPDGHALPRHAARDLHPGHRPVPLRPGHRRDAGQLDRRAV